MEGKNVDGKLPENMEIGEENEDLLLESSSVESAGSAVASIALSEDEDDEDGINITIRPLATKEVAVGTPDAGGVGLNHATGGAGGQGKLSGAKKKQLAKLLKAGIPRAEAVSKVQSSGATSTPKRGRMNDSNNSEGGDDKPESKRLTDASARVSVNYRLHNIKTGQPATAPAKHHQPLYGEVAKWVQVGILPTGFPQNQLTAQQMDIL